MLARGTARNITHGRRFEAAEKVKIKAREHTKAPQDRINRSLKRGAKREASGKKTADERLPCVMPKK